MSKLTIKPKTFSREYMKEHGHIILRRRELLVEEEVDNSNGQRTLRFKIGDGVNPYENLKYVSSLYSLFPYVDLCNSDYSSTLTISLESEE